MRHRPLLAAAALVLAAAPGAVAAGPDLGTATQLNAAHVSYVVQPAGAGTSVVVRGENGAILRRATVPGRWGIPLVTINGDVAGLGRNGRLLVLAEYGNSGNPLRARSQLLVLETRRLAVERKVSLRGDFGFDALSPDGGLLYLIEHHVASDLSRYRVRAFDLADGRLLPGVIVDKREADEPMTGFPTARVSSGDGRRVYTLYTSQEHPFVHLLDTVARAAFCIDLPSSTSATAIERAIMRLGNGGRSLTIVGGAGAGPRHVVDTSTLRVS